MIGTLFVPRSTFVGRAMMTTEITAIPIRTRTVCFSSADKITEA